MNKRGQLPPTYDVSRERDEYLVRHEESHGTRNLLLGVFLFVFFGLLFLGLHWLNTHDNAYFNPDLSRTTEIIIAIVFAGVYAIILFFLIERKETRTTETYVQAPQPIPQPAPQPVIIEKPVIREVEKPVIQVVEKPVEVIRTVEKPVLKVVEKQVIRRVPVQKTVYIQQKTKKLNIPKYEFIGSSLTKVYHKRSCRMRKSIKRMYEIARHDEAFFKRNGYTPCGLCMKQKHARVEKAAGKKK